MSNGYIWMIIQIQIDDEVKEKLKPLNPTLRKYCGSVMLRGEFFWHGPGSLVSFEVRVTTNQYKVFCGVTFISRWNFSILMEVVFSMMTMPSFKGHEGSLNALIKIKKKVWIISIPFTVSWTPLGGVGQSMAQYFPPQSSHQVGGYLLQEYFVP